MSIISGRFRVRSLEPNLEVEEAQVVGGLEVTLLGCFFIEPQGLVLALLYSEAVLVAHSQVVDAAGVALLCSFGEPDGGLLVLFEVFEEQATQGVHAFDVAVGRCPLVMAFSLVEVLLHATQPSLEVLSDLEGGLFVRDDVSFSFVLGFFEILESQLLIGAIRAVRVDPTLEEDTQLVVCVGLVVLRGQVVEGEGLVQILIVVDPMFIQTPQDHHCLRVSKLGRF
mmetsp:Transcript_18779/g.28909  ORF Transcript_18779/g.28909 Transcript_18779/m.28909 type:complete len:225 (+) Transcript_18779:902-1576(+)